MKDETLAIRCARRKPDILIDDVDDLASFMEEHSDRSFFFSEGAFNLSLALGKCMRDGEIGKWLERKGETGIASFVKPFQNSSLQMFSFALSLAVENKLPKRNFSSVVGYEAQKNTLLENGSHPDKYGAVSRRYNRKSGGAILLYGPPGCGKTNLANAYAGETSKLFLKKSGAEFLRPSAMKNAVENLKKIRNTVMFIDEIELIGVDRESEGLHSRALTIDILATIDTTLKDSGVLIIGATNTPWYMDTAVLRSGRFDELVYIGLPSLQERAMLFEFYTRGLPLADVDFAPLAQDSEFYSCSDIEVACRSAAAIPWREAIYGKGERDVTQDDFDKAMKDTEPTAIPWLEGACNIVFSENMKSRFAPMVREIGRYRKSKE